MSSGRMVGMVSVGNEGSEGKRVKSKGKEDDGEV